MIRRKAVWGGFATAALMVLLALPASAQVSMTGYGGMTTTNPSPDTMIMGDLQAGRFLVEPWIEVIGVGPASYGAELLVTTSDTIGFIGGIDNGVGAHYGVTLTVKNLQIRAMRHTRGAFENVGLYNWFLTPSKRLFLQAWVVQTSDNQSRAMMGLGYTFKE